MAGLPGEVEEVVLTMEEMSKIVRVPHIRDADANLPLESPNIELQAPAFRNQAVYQQDLRP